MHPVEFQRAVDEAAARATPSRGAHPVGVPATPPPSPSNGNGIVWEEPPRKGRHIEEELRPIVVELKRNPNNWARIKTYTTKGTAGSTLKKFRALFPDIEFRGGSHNGGSAVWARFVEAE